jgi:ferrous iron transport protein B
MGILFGSGATDVGLDVAIAGALTPAAALAFLVAQMLFVPCAATVAAIKQETRSWGWTAFSVGLLLILSLTAGILAYQLASAF